MDGRIFIWEEDEKVEYCFIEIVNIIVFVLDLVIFFLGIVFDFLYFRELVGFED